MFIRTESETARRRTLCPASGLGCAKSLGCLALVSTQHGCQMRELGKSAGYLQTLHFGECGGFVHEPPERANPASTPFLSSACSSDMPCAERGGDEHVTRCPIKRFWYWISDLLSERLRLPRLPRRLSSLQPIIDAMPLTLSMAPEYGKLWCWSWQVVSPCVALPSPCSIDFPQTAHLSYVQAPNTLISESLTRSIFWP
jgi:hypothetical protein